MAFKILIMLGAFSLYPTPARASQTAFYYGRSVPRELWLAYDQVVVEPEHVPDPRSIQPRRAEPVAYFSVGEVSPESPAARDIPSSWVLARNASWSSWVMDLAHPEYQQHLLGRYEALWRAGYQRFFLDTLDSYELGARTREARHRARAALVGLVREMVRRHPDVQLLLNRGFELLPELGGVVHGLVAESLFDRFDAATGRYTRVPEHDRKWLLERLVEARDRYHLPVTVVDYRPPAQRAEARVTAGQICALGFDAWVADGALGSVGVSSHEIIPRRVLILTNERAQSAPTDAARLLEPVLEYLGYVPEHHTLHDGLPELEIAGRYQAVISWFSSPQLPAGYPSWFRAQLQAGVRFAIFGSPGFDLGGPAARALGIEIVRPASASGARVTFRDELIGFEAEPPARPLDVPFLRITGPGVSAHLRLSDARGGEGTVIATTSWGGLALSHVFATRGLGGERAWVLNPFEFLERALQLPRVPQPDVTTEQGRRIAMWLVRARGLGERTRLRARPATANVLTRLWRSRGWPHALDVSPEQSQPPTPADLATARELSSLPFLESATLQPGSTDARGPQASLTRVQGMTLGSPSAESSAKGSTPPDGSIGPIAPDLYFLPAQSPEAYPYARVRETLEYTGSPRRLKPILLDYHASVAGSPGGMATLEQLYAWLATEDVYPLPVSEYAARVQAFREQVLLRHLDGSFTVRGGEALRTLRLPVELGFPDLAASPAVASVQRGAQGQYVSFKPGQERHLILTPDAPLLPHVVQASGAVERFSILEASAERLRIELEILGHGALSFEIAGLPPLARCELGLPGRSVHASVGIRGRLSIQLRQDNARGVLSCRSGQARS
jgi:hypothetical protein